MGLIKFKFEEDEPEEPLFGTGPPEEKLTEFPEESKKDKDEFIIDWEKRLGFSKDPFMDDIQKPIERFITGYKEEREKLNLFIIEKKRFGTISAEFGYGKSTVLFWLAKQLRRHSRKIIVLPLNGKILLEGKGFLSAIIHPFLGIIEKTIKKPHFSMTSEEICSRVKRKLGRKTLVLLVDCFTSISKQNLALLNDLFSSISIRVVFAGNPRQIDKFKSSCASDQDIAKNFNDQLNIKLHGISFKDMKDLIMKRVEFYGGIGIEPFNEPYLKKLYKKSEGSPSRMLNLCHDQAMELSVNPDKVRSLKEETAQLKAMVYSSEEFEHQGNTKNNDYDKIEIIRHENKEPIVIKGDKPEVHYSNVYDKDKEE